MWTKAGGSHRRLRSGAPGPLRRVVGAVAAGFLFLIGLAGNSSAEPLRLVVTSTTDLGDPVLDGVCGLLGVCTLRAALEEANHVAGHDTIAFDVPGAGPHRFAPISALPALTDPAGVTLDGYSQPGAVPNTNEFASNAAIRIELRGPGLNSFPGLHVVSANNVIRGLALWDFRDQVRIEGAAAHHNTVVGNFLGTDAAGTVGAPAPGGIGSHGVDIWEGDANRIGGPALGDRNVISGNYQNGITTFFGAADDTVIQNNIVGLRPDGTAGLPNRGHGIDLNGGTTDTLVGGTGAREGNVLSGNIFSGVEISHGRSIRGNRVVGNLIGTRPDGRAAPAFAANGQFGVYLEGHGEPPCTTTCPPDAGDSVVARNVIVNNARGVQIDKGQHDNVVTENHIGVLADGTAAGNRLDGVAIQKGAFGNTIGPGNVIARNASGVTITASGDSSPEEVPTYANTITQNRILRNAGLGIDLAPLGSTTPAPNANVNGGARPPTTESVSSSRVVMRSCVGCRVELFFVEGTPDAAGEGAQFVASGVANADGVVPFDVGTSSGNRIVTATSTDAAGNTSEFSPNATVPGTK